MPSQYDLDYFELFGQWSDEPSQVGEYCSILDEQPSGVYEDTNHTLFGERDSAVPSLLALPQQSTAPRTGGLCLPSVTSAVTIPAPDAQAGSASASSEATIPVAQKRQPGRPRKALEDRKQPVFYYCRYCLPQEGENAKTYQSPEGLKHHMTTHHGLLVPGAPIFACRDYGCGRQYNRETDLHKHCRRQTFHDESWLKTKNSWAFSVTPPATEQQLIDTFALIEQGEVSAHLIVPREKCPPVKVKQAQPPPQRPSSALPTPATATTNNSRSSRSSSSSRGSDEVAHAVAARRRARQSQPRAARRRAVRAETARQEAAPVVAPQSYEVTLDDMALADAVTELHHGQMQTTFDADWSLYVDQSLGGVGLT